VCGDAALYASPTNPDEWMDRFTSLRDRPALRAEMIAKGKVQAAKFSWRRSAEMYLEAFARLDGIDIPASGASGPAAEPPMAMIA